jgi:hypothetical protein
MNVGQQKRAVTPATYFAVDIYICSPNKAKGCPYQELLRFRVLIMSVDQVRAEPVVERLMVGQSLGTCLCGGLIEYVK